MNVLMTGHKGYIGSVMATLFKSAGHRVVGLDTNLFDGLHVRRLSCGDPSKAR